MIFIGTLIGFIRSIWKGLKDPEFRGLTVRKNENKG